MTLCVSDLEQALTDLGERGATGGPIRSVGQSSRKALVPDADGNSPAFIEVTASAR